MDWRTSISWICSSDAIVGAEGGRGGEGGGIEMVVGEMDVSRIRDVWRGSFPAWRSLLDVARR